MNAEQFFRLTERMRKAQKDYFSTRDKRVLQVSKDLEKQINAEIARVNNVLANAPKEGVLDFGNPQQ